MSRRSRKKKKDARSDEEEMIYFNVPVHDPSTGERIGTVANICNSLDVDEAIEEIASFFLREFGMTMTAQKEDFPFDEGDEEGVDIAFCVPVLHDDGHGNIKQLVQLEHVVALEGTSSLAAPSLN